MYLTQSLHRMVQRAPAAVASIDALPGGAERSWAELHDDVARFAGALRALGVGAGDRVAILSRNGGIFLDYILGTVWAGGVFNPINIRWTAEEMGFSLVDCDTRVLIVEPQFEPLVAEIRANAPNLAHVLSTGTPGIAGIVPRADWLDGAVPVADAVRRGDDLAAILYTGGTTGRPKGVMLSHTGLVASALSNLAHPGVFPGPRCLNSAPLFHIGALSSLFAALSAGSTCVFLPQFDPLAVLDAAARHRISDIFFVPTMLRMALDHPRFAEFDLSALRLIRYGASPIDEALLDRALAAFPQVRFSQAYGMTELSPVATILGPADHAPEARADGRLRSAGRATVMSEVRIVGPDDVELVRGETGEIVVRGAIMMQGYWNRPEATAEALRGGWMHTGDIGRMDAAGYVTVVDRLKDMIITGGENVFSAEVENALSTHPGIAQAAVIALPDARWGERVHAVIVRHAGADCDAASVEAHCRARLAGFKIPRSIEFVDALPLSGAGKVLKNVLRDRHAAPRDPEAGR